MAKFELEWLMVFDEVYRTRHVSHAAENLGLPQSAASCALGKLRQRFGDALFAKTARGMMPTPFADELIADVRATLSAADRTFNRRLTFDPSSASREFQVCCMDIGEVMLIPTLLNHLRSEAPGITVRVSHISAETAENLVSGSMDLAVGFMPGLEAGFYQQVLFNQDFVGLVAVSHPRIKSRLSLSAFSREEHLSVTTSGTGHWIIDRVLAEKAVERRIVARVPSFLAVESIIARTELVAIVPRYLGESLAEVGRVRVLDLPVSFPDYAVKLHWHERFHADPANIWLRNTMASLFRNLGSRGKP